MGEDMCVIINSINVVSQSVWALPIQYHNISAWFETGTNLFDRPCHFSDRPCHFVTIHIISCISIIPRVSYTKTSCAPNQFISWRSRWVIPWTSGKLKHLSGNISNLWEPFQNKIFWYGSFFIHKISTYRCQKWSNAWTSAIWALRYRYLKSRTHVVVRS